jgi:hypothetical protein
MSVLGVHAYSNGQVTIPREQNRPTSWRPECVVRRRFEPRAQRMRREIPSEARVLGPAFQGVAGEGK